MLDRFSKVRKQSSALRIRNDTISDIETVDSSPASSLQAVNLSLTTFAASAITVASVALNLSHSVH